jgi:alanine dehydrogenase
MRIGVPREVKDGEFRVALTPEGVGILVSDGHAVTVEAGAGSGAGFDDAQYRVAGARLVDGPAAVYDCDVIAKVKEVQASEYALLRPGRVLLCFQQLARDPALLRAVLDARITCFASEGVRDREGRASLRAPMSHIAGRLAPLIGAHWLQRQNGGSGVLLGGGAGMDPARVVILGAGNVGREAARVALALGCRVDLFARSERDLDGVRVHRLAGEVPHQLLAQADLLIGAVLEPGSLSPKLIRREHLRSMRPGSVFIDVGIDMGGIAETSRQTSFSLPTYVEEGVLHYCVPNIPASVPRTATLAYSQAMVPCVMAIARKGWRAAVRDDEGLAAGLLTHDGEVVHAQLARDTGHDLRPVV